MQLNHRRELLTWQIVVKNGYFPVKHKKQSDFVTFLKWLIGR